MSTDTSNAAASTTPSPTAAPAASPPEPHPAMSMRSIARNAIASTAGASVVGVVVTPLDVIKVRLQAHVCPVGGTSPCEDPKHVEGSLDAARKIIRSDGLRGLWRGLNVTLLLTIPTTGIYFTLYGILNESLLARHPDRSPGLTALLAGATSRVLTATAASPLELARTGLQAGVGGPDATVRSVLRHVRKTQGVRALWRGLGPTLLRDAPFSAIYWGVYETLKDPTRSVLPHRMFLPGNEFSVYLGAGIGAGGLAAVCTVPADVVKTRRQAMVIPVAPDPLTRASGTHSNSSPFSIARSIVANEGIRGLFKGATPRVAKVGPACAIMMGTFETFKQMLS